MPVLLPDVRLAKLIIQACHEEDHRLGTSDVVARSRKYAWIVRAGALAKAVIKNCMFCRLQRKKVTQQVMGELPKGRLEVAPAFSYVSLDIFGPYLASGLGGGARKSFKVWGLLYTCMSTKGFAIWACPGYSTDCFLLTHRKQTAIYGEPRVFMSDQE